MLWKAVIAGAVVGAGVGTLIDRPNGIAGGIPRVLEDIATADTAVVVAAAGNRFIGECDAGCTAGGGVVTTAGNVKAGGRELDAAAAGMMDGGGVADGCCSGAAEEYVASDGVSTYREEGAAKDVTTPPDTEDCGGTAIPDGMNIPDDGGGGVGDALGVISGGGGVGVKEGEGFVGSLPGRRAFGNTCWAVRMVGVGNRIAGAEDDNGTDAVAGTTDGAEYGDASIDEAGGGIPPNVGGAAATNPSVERGSAPPNPPLNAAYDGGAAAGGIA